MAGLGLPNNPEAFTQLLAAYSAPDRHYHNATHISECLKALNQHTDLAREPHEIAIALWFHDAVYDTRRNDNEEQSAAWAIRFLRSTGLSSKSVDRVSALILATKHTVTVNGPDQQLLVDIDLGILGQPARVFRKYDAAIRMEYAWVPDREYRTGRTAVLESFLGRSRIYKTKRFGQMYESRARANINDAINRLSTTGPEP